LNVHTLFTRAVTVKLVESTYLIPPHTFDFNHFVITNYVISYYLTCIVTCIITEAFFWTNI